MAEYNSGVSNNNFFPTNKPEDKNTKKIELP